MKTKNENYTIVIKKTDRHYDTNDERFYESNWERTKDSKEYLEGLIKNYPDKFENCIIEEN